MRHLLVINPNTSAEVTALLQTHAQQAAGERAHVRAVTARFGAAYIACESSFAVASHAALDAWAKVLAGPSDDKHPRPDAVLIGCFGDPGLFALREASPVPVTGLAEAAFVEASQHGRFAIVTGGVRWRAMLQRHAAALGYAASLAGIETVQATGAQLAQDPKAAVALLTTACQAAMANFGAKALIIGGAGLAGMARLIQPLVDVPLIDSVEAGVRYALGGAVTVPADADGQFKVAWQGVSAAMVGRGASGGLTASTGTTPV